MLAAGSGTIRMCGLVGVGVALLEEVYHFGDLPPSCLVNSPLWAAAGSIVELSAPSPAPCLPRCCCHASRLDDSVLNL